MAFRVVVGAVVPAFVVVQVRPGQGRPATPVPAPRPAAPGAQDVGAAALVATVLATPVLLPAAAAVALARPERVVADARVAREVARPARVVASEADEVAAAVEEPTLVAGAVTVDALAPVPGLLVQVAPLERPSLRVKEGARAVDVGVLVTWLVLLAATRPALTLLVLEVAPQAQAGVSAALVPPRHPPPVTSCLPRLLPDGVRDEEGVPPADRAAAPPTTGLANPRLLPPSGIRLVLEAVSPDAAYPSGTRRPAVVRLTVGAPGAEARDAVLLPLAQVAVLVPAPARPEGVLLRRPRPRVADAVVAVT